MLTRDSIKQFLKPTKKKNLSLLFFLAFVLVYFYFFVVRCTYGIFSGFDCYIASRFDGKLCDKKTDCGSGYCILVDKNKIIDKGTCRDRISGGCHTYIDEKGKFDDPFSRICMD